LELYLSKETVRAESLFPIGLRLVAEECAVVVVERRAELRFNNGEPRSSVLARALAASENHSVLAEIAVGACLSVRSCRQVLCCLCAVFRSSGVVQAGLFFGRRRHRERKCCGYVRVGVLRRDFAHKLAAVVAHNSTASNGYFGLGAGAGEGETLLAGESESIEHCAARAGLEIRPSGNVRTVGKLLERSGGGLFARTSGAGGEGQKGHKEHSSHKERKCTQAEHL